ncbi:MAG: nitronate monooxygenase family protein [Pseudolabrys sp.]
MRQFEKSETLSPRLPSLLSRDLVLPVLCSPMFIVSNPAMVVAQCLSGVIGSFPALNARAPDTLDGWLTHIETALAEAKARDSARPIAPFAVNLILHASNDRLDQDIETIVAHRVPIVITSLRAPERVVAHVHGYGGLVLHDVTTMRHAEKALEGGADGLILVCAGAGGHAGRLNPFAFVGEMRRRYDGPLVLAGAITRGGDIAAARAMGADLAYIGTRFIASEEANAPPGYKEMIVESGAGDVLYTPYFTGIPGNYLKPSIRAAGLDPDALPDVNKDQANFGSGRTKAWRDIWGAGQGVGAIGAVASVSEIVAELRAEFAAAANALHNYICTAR